MLTNDEIVLVLKCMEREIENENDRNLAMAGFGSIFLHASETLQ